jgi:hypothetical protein
VDAPAAIRRPLRGDLRKGTEDGMASDIPRTEWREFFDRVSKGLTGKWAEIEVASLDLGDQIAVEWIPLIGITYDSKNDLLDVALDRYDHLIRHPRQVIVNEADGGVTSVAVVDAEGTKQIVRMKQPLMLPATASPR